MVEDEIRTGCLDHAFLDFIRAAGDRLRQVRLLLVSAIPLERLGPHWVDRIISAKSYELGYLERDAAEDLLVAPCPGFPAIYPEGGVDLLPHRPALRSLVRYQFVVQEDGRPRIAVPLFASWIREELPASGQ